MVNITKLFCHMPLCWGFLRASAALELGPNYKHSIEDLDKDLPFSQPVTFSHLPWERCLAQAHDDPLDLVILGFPYDTSTSYRPGARFGPRGIRSASSREKKGRSYNTIYGLDPFTSGDLRMVDCGDIPITPFDAQHAFKQMEQAYRQVLFHNTSSSNAWERPRVLSMGGDHSIVLPILRSLKEVYGSISVIHLDSHLDTWDPYAGYTGIASEQSAITHGTFFWHAAREGCIAKGSSVHGGLRSKLFGPEDYVVDRDVVGFEVIEAHEIDEEGGMGRIVDRVRKVVGTKNPVYLSIDIDGKCRFAPRSSNSLANSSPVSPRSQHRTSDRDAGVRRMDNERAEAIHQRSRRRQSRGRGRGGSQPTL